MRKLTITVEEDVYAGLQRRVGPRRISKFLNDLARPYVIEDDLDAAYAAMAEDQQREREALEWAEAMVSDVADEPR